MNEMNERMNEMNEWTDVQVQRQLVEKQPQRDTLPPCRRMREESTIFRLGPPAEKKKNPSDAATVAISWAAGLCVPVTRNDVR